MGGGRSTSSWEMCRLASWRGSWSLCLIHKNDVCQAEEAELAAALAATGRGEGNQRKGITRENVRELPVQGTNGFNHLFVSRQSIGRVGDCGRHSLKPTGPEPWRARSSLREVLHCIHLQAADNTDVSSNWECIVVRVMWRVLPGPRAVQ